MQFLSLLILSVAWAEFEEVKAPYKLHFQRHGGKPMGAPLGTIYNPDDQLYHMFFVAGVDTREVSRIVRGDVGYATSDDLMEWTVNAPVVEADEKEGGFCIIDGGSVLFHDSKYLMYYSQRCCDADDLTKCPTTIRRAESDDAKTWTKLADPIMEFATDHAKMPSVVYETTNSRFIMATVGPTGSRPFYHQKPTFYFSTDGITSWSDGATWEPNCDEGDTCHFRDFRAHFMFPLDDHYIMTGQDNKDMPVFFAGDFDDTTGVFNQTRQGRGEAAFLDWAFNPFPVLNHPNAVAGKVVMMSMMKQPSRGLDFPFAVPFQPLAFPIVASYQNNDTFPSHEASYMWAGEFAPTVLARVESGSGTRPEMELPPGETVVVDPSAVSAEGLYYFKGTMEVQWYTDEVGVRFNMFDEDENLVWGFDVSRHRWVTTSDLRLTHYVPTKSGYEPANEIEYFLPLRATAHDVEILIDRGVVEVIVDGFVTREHFFTEVVGPVSYFTIYNRRAERRSFAEGWVFDPVTPVRDQPEEPTEEPVTTVAPEPPTDCPPAPECPTAEAPPTAPDCPSSGVRAAAGVALILAALAAS